MKWIKLNTPVKLNSMISLHNYYDPLTSRVNTQEKVNVINMRPIPHQQQSSLQIGPTRNNSSTALNKTKRVRFSLPTSHVEKNSKEWRRKWDKSLTINLLQSGTLKNKLKMGVLNGSIPSAASDTGASASAFESSAPTIPIGIQSNTMFGGAFGNITKATTINKLHHKLWEPAEVCT